MKRQVLTQKISVFIFMALSFIYCSRSMAHGNLEFTEGESTTREIVEQSSAGTNIGEPLRYSTEEIFDCVRLSLHGPDAQAFDLVPVYRGGQLKTKSTLDYETQDTYEVQVIATGSSFLTRDAITVTISVTDVNEIPFFSEEIDETPVNLVHRLIPENTPVGINIGKPVSAIDPDGSDVNLIYSLRGPDAHMFKIDSNTGQLRTKMPLDYEAFESDPRTYFVEVEVSDGMASAKTEVQIDVTPVNEFAPMFIEGETATREIHEKEGIGVNVGDPLTATDMDAGETLEYSLSDTDGKTFEINSTTGQLRIKAKLDYETKPVYTVKVVASDGTRVGSIIVTIQVLTEFVDIPDRSLATMIRLTLRLAASDGITEERMLDLTKLAAGPNSRLTGLGEIEDLTGLEYAKNLKTLLLTSNSVRDLTPLTGLTRLERLEIYGNKVVFLTPLKNLTKLKKLDLGFNWIHDITPLAGLTNLTELMLHSNNSVKDITALAGLTNLRILNLSGNLITDISPLSNSTNLRTLHLRYNSRLTDVKPLAGLVNLETLTLTGCAVTDLSPLEALTADIDIRGGSAPAMNGSGSSSLLDSAILQTLDKDVLQTELQRLRVESDGSLKYQHAIAMLETALASMRPDKTALMPNYPNPFNPETWIPYHLGNSANVQITVYDAHGTAIRHLELGLQSAGYYTSRNQAAYWDGKNDFGERVASGVYFYQLQADTMSPLRKMVILK